jgi:hypothetical protein
LPADELVLRCRVLVCRQNRRVEIAAEGMPFTDNHPEANWPDAPIFITGELPVPPAWQRSDRPARRPVCGRASRLTERHRRRLD